MIPNLFIFSLGFIAQGLFSARLLVQWLTSEKAKKVMSPAIFWQLSIFASLLLLIYGILRKDIVIAGGQLITYYIYVRNLKIQKAWTLFPPWLRWTSSLAPLFALLFLFFNHQGYNVNNLIHNPTISIFTFTLGSVGQIIFTFRFVFQWVYSEKKGESLLPVTFWWISLAGALITVGYAVIRQDPVILLGQIFGTVVYGRNLILDFIDKKNDSEGIKRDDKKVKLLKLS
ncbi:MAG TPA: lipid-A-disaccharide synthase N-terminal domain-containing protein [Marinilabiliaceae bacterium]|nr:lipid-A-disaccharide synthase N-terminal domain-containing protein [Marinilabiliaceae bacterium]